ncbi:MAG: MotA/TolQ/ExbB proton channel family protein [Labilithrix sp.]|nr:MotA/TolQ/ExbB proton channel family protein [Labilithrix sp.]MCW5812777.1 MotA/TolQ/ExbB proton channel family protein [Labilithrix sp.]
MDLSPLHIWASMGPLSKVIASILLLMATMIVAVFVERNITLLRARAETKKFLRAVVALLTPESYARAVEVAGTHKASPFARLMAPVLGKLGGAEEKNLSRVEVARREAERQKELVGEDLRRGMNVLASVGSVAPFVGLLGTVVGIITAFQGIASTGSGGLGAVSAGIAEALVETALGLMVAIPAVLFFNQLNAKITAVETELARRTGELLDELENSHGRVDSGKLQKAV